MSRTLLTWSIFSAALVLVLTVMLFFTVRILQFERQGAIAETRAAVEENIRLALWRMDSTAAGLLSRKLKTSEVANNLGNNRNNDYNAQSYAQQRADPNSQILMSQQELRQREVFTFASPGNWHKIEPALLDRIGDLLPGAKLEAVDAAKMDANDTRRLASIPARLVVPPAAFQTPPLPWNTPLRVSLMVAWICAIVASVAVAVLLRGALALSERRGAFVSTVTHELRTPLTTFKMYSEMLATGMVGDPQARQQYLDTLVSESDRLGHLIENVLAYARLERQLSPSRAQTLVVGDLIERGLPSLRRRAQQAGLELNVAIATDATDATCATDTIAVQQILLNLVDNACKYGRTTIDLAVAVIEGRLEVKVADRGPGLDVAARSRLFRAFSKSRTDAVPGIGLGLYLSRRLARDLGGDLHYVPTLAGTTFSLTLPLKI